MKHGVKFGALAMIFAAALPTWAAGSQLSRQDIEWLDRVTYGPTTATLDEYVKVGRRRFLNEQLHPKEVRLPQPRPRRSMRWSSPIVTVPSCWPPSTRSKQRINALTDEAQKQTDRKALNERGNNSRTKPHAAKFCGRCTRPPTAGAVDMVLADSFSAFFQYKANDAWLVGDYADNAIRPHALGRFRDLVMATLTHPAMLQYLDNAQNAAGHINENYARELMELHTLGVDSGYTQQDIQELARILTGAGVNASGNEPRLKPEWQRLYRHQGAFRVQSGAPRLWCQDTVWDSISRAAGSTK